MTIIGGRMATLNESGTIGEWLVQLHWAAEWQREASWSINKLSSPCTIIWLVLNGSKTVRLDDAVYELEAGNLAIIPPNVSITVHPTPNDALILHHLAVGMTARIGTLDLFDRYRFPRVSPLGDAAARHAIVDCWQRLIAETEQLEGNELRMIRINELTYRLLDQLIQPLQSGLAAPPATIDPRVQSACQYIRQQLSVKPSMAAISRHVYTSESHLRLLFRKTLGVSPMDYMRQVRVERARELLSATKRSLKEISWMLGFEDQSQFSREFRGAEGISPQDYRRRWQPL
jgi:AraC-like DNA-binding protein